MPSLYALFVAINEYPNPSDNLMGCLPDMKHLSAYLKEHCALINYEFKSYTLLNKDATRERIILGFDHFNNAVAGDTCLFAFFGHGARFRSLGAFDYAEEDSKAESIVCWDATQQGRADLMDKEISYLIWKATKDKQIHFISIMDCCHSGRMRSQSELQGKIMIRNLETDSPQKPIEDYLGFEHYQDLGHGQFNPPRGRYVHLAAAQDRQTAKEVYVGDSSRGVFTFSLIEALEEAKGLISYSELIDRCNRRTRLIVRDQSPQLVTTHSIDQSRLFLTHKEWEGPLPYLVSYDKELGWNINAGEIHGLSLGEGEHRTSLQLLEPTRQLHLTSLLADRAIVEGMDGLDKRRSYHASLQYLAEKQIGLGFGTKIDQATKDMLLSQLVEEPSPYYRITNSKTAHLLIRVKDGQCWLSRRHDEVPLFRKSDLTSLRSMRIFLQKLEIVARWWLLLQRTNPNTRLGEKEVEISLFRVTDPRREDSFAPSEQLAWQDHPVLSYTSINGRLYAPSFQIRIKNTSLRPLWFSLIFLGVELKLPINCYQKSTSHPNKKPGPRSRRKTLIVERFHS